MLQITAHKFEGVPYRQATSWRNSAIKPEMIVAHDTAGSLAKCNVVNYFASPSCGASAHIVLERDGTFTQMVPFNRVAHHAGASSWNGKANCNARSIGIEIVNPGMLVKRGNEALLIYRVSGKDKIVGRWPIADCVEVNTPEHGKGWCLPYTDAQITAVKDICKMLVAEYPSITEIVTHWMISPKRKVDTNPLFPLDEVRAAVFEPAPAPEEAIEVAHAPEVGKASLLDTSERHFAKINALAEQGSRIGIAIRNFGRWFWSLLFGTAATGGTMLMSDPNKGTAAVVASNPRLLWIIAGVAVGAIIAGAAAYLFVKFRIVPGLISAHADGRYQPRGGK